MLFLPLVISSFLKLKDAMPTPFVTRPRQPIFHVRYYLMAFLPYVPDIDIIYRLFLPARIIIYYFLEKKILLVF